jgi:MFS transporter, PPP family, 3-phenylpropionic acid transporter
MRYDSKYSVHLFIFVFYMTQAALNPYLAYWFSSEGLSNKQIGLLFSLGPVLGLFIQPLWGILCDRFGWERRILMLSTIAAPLLALGYWAAGAHFWLYALTALGLAITYSAMTPISEALTVRHAQQRGVSYGGIRLLGSISFAITTAVLGEVYNDRGLSLMFLMYGVLMAILFASLFLLKAPSTERSRIKRPSLWTEARPFLTNRPLLLFLLLVFGISVGSAMNGVFFPIYVAEAGSAAAASIGLLNMVAALSELPLFLMAGRLIQRFGYHRIFVFIALMASLRWLLLSLEPPFWVLVGAQMLHGVTFALFIAAGVTYMHEMSPAGFGTTGQTLFAVVSSNLSMLVASNLGGWLLDQHSFSLLYQFTSVLCLVCAAGFLWKGRTVSADKNVSV